MDDRTCAVCGESFTPRTWNQRYCTGYRGKCYRAAMNASYRSTTETAECVGCGAEFERVRGRSQHVYCSETCHHQAKAERYSGPVVAKAQFPPVVGSHDVARYKRVLRSDPCAYCGQRGGCRDHIVPTVVGGEDEWTNLTGACHVCNSTKWAMPLLIFLGYQRARAELEPWRAVVAEMRRESAEPPGDGPPSREIA